MKQLHEMSFQEFADHAKPSSGMNRWPQLTAAQDVVSYSVYMNGELANRLPENMREYEFRDVLLHPLCEKLGLDPHSTRDNLKVAQMLALHHAYMQVVLQASFLHPLPPQTQADYALLADEMSHPIIQAAIAEHRRLNGFLPPLIEQAEQVLGRPVEGQAASGVSRGEMVSQNEVFSVQNIGDGRVVVHENSRLEQLPVIGENVIVAYYRGQGQVIEDMQSLVISEPYVEPISGDLAVKLFAGAAREEGNIKRVILFNSLALIEEFAIQNALGDDFMGKAIEARAANPKRTAAKAERSIVGIPFIDADSGLPAFVYQEQGLRFTAVFNTPAELLNHAQTMGASASFLQALPVIAEQASQILPAREAQSWQAAAALAAQTIGTAIQRPNLSIGRYAGPIVAVTDLHVVQDLGRGSAVIHDKRTLDKVPLLGERLTIHYSSGRGAVTLREAAKQRSADRSSR